MLGAKVPHPRQSKNTTIFVKQEDTTISVFLAPCFRRVIEIMTLKVDIGKK